MSKLQEFDDLLNELKNEVILTQSVNRLSDQLYQKGQQQAEQLEAAHARMSTTTKNLSEAAKDVIDISKGSAQLLGNKLKTLSEQHDEGIKQLDKLMVVQLNELRSQQNKHFVELSNSLEVRLDNHRSEIRQIVEQESARLSKLLLDQIVETEALIRQQGDAIKGLWYIAVAQTVLILAAIAAKLLHYW